MLRIATAAIALTLAGCATFPTSQSGTPAGETITYQTTACHGFCPLYTVAIAPDGTGVFTGAEHVAAVGERPVVATPAQAAAFTAALAPYRPASGETHLDSPDLCGARYATDLPGVIVSWSGGGKLVVDYGCDMQTNRAMFAALKAAPSQLPLADLVGKR
jgi:hypothetical protein